MNKENIRIAEMYKKEHRDVTLYMLHDGQILEEKPLAKELIKAQRVERRPIIKWYKLTAREILEETEWPGEYIPIVPVYGVETWLEGKKQAFSLINPAKDPQKMLNYWKTASVEAVALQPRAPFVGAVGQFKSAQKSWQDMNKRNIPVLQYDPVTHKGVVLPPPQRQSPPVLSPAMMQEATAAGDGIKYALGMHDAALGVHGGEISGSAIAERKLQGDNSTFHYIDNLAIALKHVGRILVDLIPKVYNGARVARILGIDGTPELVKVNQVFEKENGDTVVHNLSKGRYDVVVDVGESYASKRQQAVQSMLDVAAIDSRIMEVAPLQQQTLRNQMIGHPLD
jgi:hypothetical protein